MKRNTILSMVFLLIACTMATAADFDAYVYWIDPGTLRTIAWDPAPGADGYEIIVRRMESGKALYSGTVTDPKIAIRFNTTGHNVVYLRAFKGAGAAREYGEWKNTLDPSFAVVNSVPKAWVMAIHTY